MAKLSRLALIKFLRGCDWGAYLSATKGPALPFKDLFNAGLLDFFVTKGCQEAEYYSSIKNILWAREVGCRAVGSYYWHFPTWTPEYQIKIYGDAIRAEKPDFIALDMEDAQGLSDWAVTTNAEAVCEGLVRDFPDLPFFVYTSADYINSRCPIFNRSINKYKRWIACWPGVIPTGMDRYLSFDEIKAYPLPDWKIKLPNGLSGWDIWQDNNWAIPEGYGWPYNHQYDWSVCSLTIEQLTGKEVSTMPIIYKSTVPMADRAWGMEVKGNQKVVGGYGSLGVDFITLPMVNCEWDGNRQPAKPEETFQGRAKEISAIINPNRIFVFGKVQIDAGMVLRDQHTQEELDGHSVWDNLVVREMLNALHIGTWSPGNVSNNFVPINAIIFEQTNETAGPYGEVGDFWQAHFFKYVVDRWRVLVTAGAVPNVPLILKTTSAFLQKYKGDFANMLADLNRQKWLYLGLSSVPSLASTSTFPDLYSIFKNTPGDGFQWSYMPDGYADRTLILEFSSGKQKLTGLTDSSGKILLPIASLSKFCDNAKGMTDLLKTTPVVPPVDPGPEDDVIILKARIAELETSLLISQKENADWIDWFTNMLASAPVK